MELSTNRGLFKYIVLSILTLGIYGIVVMSVISSDINTIASGHDGKKTMHYCLLIFVVSWLTLGIGVLVWYHRISERIGQELVRRNINYSFGAGTFWGWDILGVLLLCIGPFVYLFKLLKSMNLLCEDYNEGLNKNRFTPRFERPETSTYRAPAQGEAETARHKPSEKNEKDHFEQIRKFKQLLDEGIITEEEFAAKKEELHGL